MVIVHENDQEYFENPLDSYIVKQRKFKEMTKKIQDVFKSKVYKKKGYSLDGYIKEKWNISKTQAYRYLISAKVIDQLEEFEIQPAYERICRTLNNYAKTPEQMKLLWGSIIRKAGTRPDCINSSHVNKMWKELLMCKNGSHIVNKSRNVYTNEKCFSNSNPTNTYTNVNGLENAYPLTSSTNNTYPNNNVNSLNNMKTNSGRPGQINSIQSACTSNTTTTINYNSNTPFSKSINYTVPYSSPPYSPLKIENESTSTSTTTNYESTLMSLNSQQPQQPPQQSQQPQPQPQPHQNHLYITQNNNTYNTTIPINNNNNNINNNINNLPQQNPINQTMKSTNGIISVYTTTTTSTNVDATTLNNQNSYIQRCKNENGQNNLKINQIKNSEVVFNSSNFGNTNFSQENNSQYNTANPNKYMKKSIVSPIPSPTYSPLSVNSCNTNVETSYRYMSYQNSSNTSNQTLNYSLPSSSTTSSSSSSNTTNANSVHQPQPQPQQQQQNYNSIQNRNQTYTLPENNYSTNFNTTANTNPNQISTFNPVNTQNSLYQQPSQTNNYMSTCNTSHSLYQESKNSYIPQPPQSQYINQPHPSNQDQLQQQQQQIQQQQMNPITIYYPQQNQQNQQNIMTLNSSNPYAPSQNSNTTNTQNLPQRPTQVYSAYPQNIPQGAQQLNPPTYQQNIMQRNPPMNTSYQQNSQSNHCLFSTVNA